MRSADSAPAANFVRRNRLAVLGISALLLVPCFWHRHIEAGDLGSHVYNAWLASVIQQGNAPGLYLATRWNNVLCDVAFLYTAKLFGFAAAEKVVVGLCVLIFFWGVFSFVAAVSSSARWFLTPVIAMLSYGYVFNMGFLNYYLSLGLASVGLALAWRGGRGSWRALVPVALLTLLAHPVGFLWLVGIVLYLSVHRRLPGLSKLAVPLVALSAFFGIHWYLANRAAFEIDWTGLAWYWRNGADQLAVYGPRYTFLSFALLGFGLLCGAVEVLERFRGTGATGDRLQEAAARQENSFWQTLLLFEWYAVALVATGLLPENLRPDPGGGWIGLLVSRLTLITAVFGLLLLGRLRPRAWHLAGLAAIAAFFFTFLYQDTDWISRTETNAERLLSGLPDGTRVIPNVDAPADWRVPFIVHSVDRACIGHCFIYSNYEPASGQFRIRVSGPGSSVATGSTDDAENMQAGEYVVKPSDPPLVLLYQCDDRDLRTLCLAHLKPGEKTQEPE